MIGIPPRTPSASPTDPRRRIRGGRWMGGSVCAAVMALLVAGAALPARAADGPPVRVIVTLKADAPLLREQPMGLRQSASEVALAAQRRADRLAARAGVALTTGAAISERAQVMTASGIDAATLARRLAADPEVLRVAVDQRRRALYLPNDPLYAAGPASGRGPDVGQWYLRAPGGDVRSAINAEAAWDRVTGNPGIVVAVVDTGVLADHLDLAGQVLPGYDMVSDPATANDGNGRDADASDAGDWVTAAENGARGGDFQNCGISDSSWHGTKIAGLIGAAANNGLGMAGSAFGVRILPVRVLGKCGGYDSDIQAGMRWAAGLAVPGLPLNPNPARILNLSLGGSGACTAATGYPAVIAELQAAGVVVVAAAGNSAGHAVELPANCPGVIAVAGLRHAGSKVGFSDLGPEISISAPAGNCVNDPDQGLPCLYPILSTTNSGRTTPAGATYTDSFFPLALGTSFSSPLVAGVIGLMLSRDINLTPTQIRDVLKATARPFPTTSSTVPAVAACRPSSTGPQGSECYCTTSSCGVGLLDARAAVNAVGTGGVMPPLITINASNTAPARGTSVSLDASGTTFSGGRSAFSYSWAVTGGGSVGTLGAAGGASTTVLINTVGEVTVQLVVTDTGGNASTSSVTLYSQEAPADSGGGGAMSTLWNALVGLAVAVLAWQRRRPARG